MNEIKYGLYFKLIQYNYFLLQKLYCILFNNIKPFVQSYTSIDDHFSIRRLLLSPALCFHFYLVPKRSLYAESTVFNNNGHFFLKISYYKRKSTILEKKN